MILVYNKSYLTDLYNGVTYESLNEVEYVRKYKFIELYQEYVICFCYIIAYYIMFAVRGIFLKLNVFYQFSTINQIQKNILLSS